MLHSSIRLLVSVCRETSEQNNEGRKEEADHSSQDRPHASRVVCMTSTSIPVHVSLDDAKEYEIGDHNHQRNEPCNSSNHGGQQSTADAGTKSEEESNECKTAGDRVENHDAGKGLCGIGGSGVEVGAVNGGHHVNGVVSNVLAGAVILVGISWRNIEHTVSKGSKGNTRVSDIALVGKHNLHDRDVMDDWRRDGGDQQQNRCCEEEEGAHMVEDSSFGHCDVLVRSRLGYW